MAVFTLNKPLISEIFSDIYYTYLTNIFAKFCLNWMSAFSSSTFAENDILSIFFAICCFGRDQVIAIYQAIRYHEFVAYFIPTPYTAADSFSNPIVNGHLVMADGTIIELWTPTPASSPKALVQPSSDFVVEVREEVVSNKEELISEPEHSDIEETSSSASDTDSDSESSYSTGESASSPTLSAASDSSFSSTESKSSRVSAYDWAAEDDDDELPPLDFADMVGCSTSSPSSAPVAVAPVPAPLPSTPRIQPRSFASRSLKQLAVLEEDEEEEEDDEEDCHRYSSSERNSRFVSMSAIRLIPSLTLRRTGRHWEKPFELIRYMPEASYEQRSTQYMYCFGVELLGRDL